MDIVWPYPVQRCHPIHSTYTHKVLFGFILFFTFFVSTCILAVAAVVVVHGSRHRARMLYTRIRVNVIHGTFDTIVSDSNAIAFRYRVPSFFLHFTVYVYCLASQRFGPSICLNVQLFFFLRSVLKGVFFLLQFIFSKYVFAIEIRWAQFNLRVYCS